MTPGSAPRLGSRRVYAGRLLTVDVDTVRAPDESTIELEIVRHSGAAAVVPFLSDPDGPDPQVLMLRQYRYAVEGTIWEIPAGLLRPGEEPLACAHRELLEETGAHAERIEPLTTIYTTPGFTDERIHLFMASGLVVGEPSHEPDEFIEMSPQPLSRLLELIRSGELADAKTIVALLFAAGFRLNR
jgi:ADP-ribose pyrophosphatase